MILFNNKNNITVNEIAELMGAKDGSIIYESEIINEQVKISDISGDMSIKGNSRCVMLNNAELNHYARMKVSMLGRSVTKNKNENISIYCSTNRAPMLSGKLSNINMSNREYYEYEDLFIRNLNLIYLNGNTCPQAVKSAFGKNLVNYIDISFLHDERMRIYIKYNDVVIKFMDRDALGNLYLYDKNKKLLIKLNLAFDVVEYNQYKLKDLFKHYIPFLEQLDLLIDEYRRTHPLDKIVDFMISIGIHI